LLRAAAEELDLDLSRSWMIGDSYADVQAGQAAGCRTILLATKAGSHERTATSLLEAADIILAHRDGVRSR
jgi:phosphoglycolate phosphatase-like HAD superfamily hydrolase